MHCASSSHLWLGRYSVQLMQLRQAMTLREAVARAVQAHGRCRDLPPEEAARIDAQVETHRVPSAARTGVAETASA